MKTYTRKRLILVFVGMCPILAGVSKIALANQDTSRAKAIGWLIQHQNGDGSWGLGSARVAATAEALAGLKNAGADKGFHYTRALAWLSNCQTDSVDALARKIIALENAGVGTVDRGLISALLEQANIAGVWGAYAGYGGGFPDSGLAMEALRRAGVTAPTAAYINLTSSGQGSGNRGWSYWGVQRELAERRQFYRPEATSPH